LSFFIVSVSAFKSASFGVAWPEAAMV